MRVRVRQLAAALRRPFTAADRKIEARELILLELEARDGCTGWGESAPLDVEPAKVRAALEAYAPILAHGDDAGQAELMAACSRAVDCPEALAAVDLALWDLAGRRAGQPVWRLLGAERPGPTAVNATIASPDRGGAAEAAGQASRAGFRCLKVKVGLGDDSGRLAAVRAAAGPDIAIRLDANGAWSVAQARATLERLARIGLELCEEPVHGLAAVAELAVGCQVPIAMDETTSTPGALDRRACAAVCLKLGRFGGLTGTLESARRARASGYQVYLASALDGPLGIAAALHLAALLVPEHPCGLATLGWFADRADPLAPASGAMRAPSSPGLGVELPAWYA